MSNGTTINLDNRCRKERLRNKNLTSDQILFNLYAEYIMRNAGLGEISITSDMQMTPPLWQKVKKN